MIPIVKTRVAMLAALLSIAALAGPAAQGGQPPAAPSARPAAAQLTGSIKNEGGEAMAGASVTMTDAQQRTQSAVSDARGVYGFKDLPPGIYQLAVDVQGYAPISQALTLAAGTNGRVDVTLRLAIVEQVEVMSSLADFRRATGLSPVGLVLGPEDLSVLPNDPDMMLQVLRELSATTGRADQVAVRVDGQPASGRLPPKEAIQSIRISTNAFAPEFAEPSAGLVEIVTRPATAAYRGDAQVTFSDSRLNAANAFEPEKQPSQISSLSGYLGGPIVRGKWSFLGYGGRWDRDDQLVVNATTASPSQPSPTPFVQSVETPARIDSYSFRTDVAVSPDHVISLDVAHQEERERNMSLESGLDLPERATDRRAREDAGRLSLVSSLGEGIGSELRIRGRRRLRDEAAVSTAPAVLVFDAFNGGGNQAALAQRREIRDLSVSWILSQTRGSHDLRAGLYMEGAHINETRQTNLGGTFVFGAGVNSAGAVVSTPLDRYIGTLRGLPGFGPSYFSIARGAPTIDYNDWQAAWFLQDDWRFWRDLTFSFGIRHDLQRPLASQWNFAPRVGLAWTPGGTNTHTVRASAGVFHGPIPFDVTLDINRYDGVLFDEVIVVAPTFFPAIPSSLEGQPALSAVRQGDELDSPRSLAANTNYEWQFGKMLVGSIGYTYLRGNRLLRTRNINTITPATGQRFFPDRGPILQFESTGSSEAHQLNVTVRRALADKLSLFGAYIARWAKSDTDGPYTVAEDAFALLAEYGRAGDDERHRVVAGGSINLPRDMSLNALVRYGSGRPFNITTGRDDNLDLIYEDRPVPASATDPAAIVTPFGAFSLVRRPGDVTIARNAGLGPRQFGVAVGFSKLYRLMAPDTGPYVVFTISVDNLTNYTNYVDFNGVVTSPLFGLPNRALPPRRIELAARIGF